MDSPHLNHAASLSDPPNAVTESNKAASGIHRPVPGLTDVESTGLNPSSAEARASTEQDEIIKKKEAQQRQSDRKQIQTLAARDREVRAHEQAHAAVGGQYAGAPNYQFQRGPDGLSYAVGGEVSIDVAPAASAEETIRKMQIVRAAALAPAEPSAQDRRVAAQASAALAQAQAELASQRRNEESGAVEAASEQEPSASSQEPSVSGDRAASFRDSTVARDERAQTATLAPGFKSLEAFLQVSKAERTGAQIFSYRV